MCLQQCPHPRHCLGGSCEAVFTPDGPDHPVGSAATFRTVHSSPVQSNFVSPHCSRTSHDSWAEYATLLSSVVKDLLFSKRIFRHLEDCGWEGPWAHTQSSGLIWIKNK